MLIARDSFGNQRRSGNESVSAVARRLKSDVGTFRYAGNDATTFQASVVDHGNGSYTLSYTAEEAGVYLLAITMNTNTSLASELHSDQGVGIVSESLRPFHV